MRYLALLVFASSILALAAGCGSHSKPGYLDPGVASATRPLAPDAALPVGLDGRPGDGYVPLDLGDRWVYLYSFKGTLVSDGSPLYDESGEFVDDIACEQDVSGLHYFISRRLFNGDNTTPQWTRYRQDRAGLYVLDFADHESPPCATPWTPRPRTAAAPAAGLPALERFAARLPRGAAATAAWQRAYATLVQRHELLMHLARGLGARQVAPGETQQLAYPLVPGQHWVIRDDPHFEARVERGVRLSSGRESFHGWSVRISSALFEPDDVVNVFWGRDGYLGLEAVFYADATDETGEIIGRIRTHETQSLAELNVVGGRHRDAPVSFGGIQ